MASREWSQLREVLQPGLADPSDPPALVREKMHALHPTQVPSGTEVEHTSLGGVPAAWVGPSSDRVLLLVHGGAFVSTGVEHYVPYAARLVPSLRSRILVFDYRLAPEHPFPAALEDSLAVYRALLADGVAPDRIAVGGDSCGAGIGLALLLRLRDEGLPLPSAFVSLTGWFDLEMTGDSARRPLGVDPFVDPDWIRARGRDYAGPDGDVRDPLVSPIHADLTGLPPMFLSCGQVDITRDDSTRLAARAARAGVMVTLEVVPEMIHGFHGLADLVPEGRASLGRAGVFLDEWLSPRPAP